MRGEEGVQSVFEPKTELVMTTSGVLAIARLVVRFSADLVRKVADFQVTATAHFLQQHILPACQICRYGQSIF